MTASSSKPGRSLNAASRMLAFAAAVALLAAAAQGTSRSTALRNNNEQPIPSADARTSAQEISPLMNKWNTIAMKGPNGAQLLAALYTEDAMLTTFDRAEPVQGRDAIEDYFYSSFLALKPLAVFAANATTNCALSLNRDVCTRSGSLTLRVLLPDPVAYDVKVGVSYPARALVVYQLFVNGTAVSSSSVSDGGVGPSVGAVGGSQGRLAQTSGATREWLIAEMHLSMGTTKPKA